MKKKDSLYNGIRGSNDLRRWKPKGFQDYLTVGELAEKIGYTTRWIKILEKQNKLPAPIRVNVGKLSVRLYGPDTIEQIVLYFQEHRTIKPKDRKGGRRMRRVQS